MNIEGHLEEDRDRIEFLAKRYANNRDDMEDVRQEIILKMIERHGAFDHDHKSGASLLSYVQYVLKREVIFPTLDDYQHITDNTVVIPPLMLTKRVLTHSKTTKKWAGLRRSIGTARATGIRYPP